MNLNGTPSNPGELNTKVTLLAPSLATDGGGAQRPTFTTLATVYARWQNVHGEEVWAANQAGKAVSAATVLLRYRSDISPRTWISKGTRQYETVLVDGKEVQQEITEVYEIVSVDNIMNRNEYLELKVRRTTGSI